MTPTDVQKRQRWSKLFIGSIGLLIAYWGVTQSTFGGTADVESLKRFEQWAAIAGDQHESPALSSSRSHDLKAEWQGPDGKTVKLVVRQPVFMNNRKRVFVSPPEQGVDARPLIENALQRIRAENANTLSLAPGDYHFLTIEPKFKSHLKLEELSDFIIEGNGARFIFHNEAHGLWIQQSQRIRVEQLALDYAIRTTSIGSIVERAGRKVLVIDKAYPVTAKNNIAQIAELQPDKMSYVVGGGRVIFIPKDGVFANFVGEQTYESPRFNKLVVGSRYMVLHQYYGAQVVKIDGHRTPKQTEDITLAGLKIHASPGMGITTTGLRRGLAVIDSQFVAAKDGLNPGSVSWDGVNVHSGGGDILITGNRFELMMDDAINIYSPVHPIKAIDAAAKSVMLAVSSRFISQGDTLAFFSNDGGFQGTAKVIANPAAAPNNEYLLNLDQLPPGVTTQSLVRTVELITRRFKIADNTIENISGHAILAQIPHGLIANNTVRNINRNAIRLLSDIGTWNEGVGAFNVAVRGNTIVNPGLDPELDFPWAAITVYSGASGRVLSQNFYNRDLEISDNHVENYKQGCISVMNSLNVVARGNSCVRDPKADKAAKPWVSLRSAGVVNQ
jgi:hypothetical protein